MRVERYLPFMILATVALSGLLLGMGQGDFEPFVVAVVGASAAIILVDWLKWFRLPNWVANLLAILVTTLTVSNFYFTNDSVRHLLGVGKLLVYLQTILMFQRKSARVYWQVLVLSLLQIVVGAVFNLGFEGGVLFIIYMMVAGVTMMMLHLYQDRHAVRLRNDEIREMAASNGRLSRGQALAISNNPVMQRGILRRMVISFFIFATGALFFSILLFYFLPRDHSSWSGPQEVPMKNTGFDETVSMDHSEVILLSSKLQMNVRYRYAGNDKQFQPNSVPYLRGMALNNITVEANRTRWIPPPYQVYTSDFRPLLQGNDQLWVLQEIVLEPTEDPLLYTAMPPRVASDEELLTDFEWCWPLGGLTRQRNSEKITVSHFRYTLKVPILENGDFYSAYPYVSRPGDRSLPLTEKRDPGTYKWLTYLDRSRYPEIVRVAAEIAELVADGDHLTIAQQMEAHFRSDDFTYTLDFRNIQRDPDLDTVEDFFANFRSGHCEYYASALALMLRSAGIPARVVVGFRGGDVNGFGGHLDVEAKHAHAWVEAYIPREDCSDYMLRTGQARTYGAWLRLDPTPAFNLDDGLTGTDDALDFAKSLWRDYVLGLQADSPSFSADRFKLAGALRVLDLDWWQNSAQKVQDDLQEPGGWKKYSVPAGAIAVVLICIALYLWQGPVSAKSRQSESTTSATAQTSGIRGRLARALGVVSPRLARWVGGDDSGTASHVPFYSRMLESLDRAGFEKEPQQTGREFAAEVTTRISLNGSSERVGTLTKTITDFYYLVRFGGGQLDEQQSATVKSALDDLQDLLKQTGNS